MECTSISNMYQKYIFFSSKFLLPFLYYFTSDESSSIYIANCMVFLFKKNILEGNTFMHFKYFTSFYVYMLKCFTYFRTNLCVLYAHMDAVLWCLIWILFSLNKPLWNDSKTKINEFACRVSRLKHLNLRDSQF